MAEPGAASETETGPIEGGPADDNTAVPSSKPSGIFRLAETSGKPQDAAAAAGDAQGEAAPTTDDPPKYPNLQATWKSVPPRPKASWSRSKHRAYSLISIKSMTMPSMSDERRFSSNP